MRIACVYTTNDYETVEKPLATSRDIPFGISMIATLLQENHHEIDLLVVSRGTAIDNLIGGYIADKQPKLFCLSAVSSQFHMAEKVARAIKEADPSIFVILGGHHASLAPQDAIQSPYLDAICIGEGDQAVIELASHIESSTEPPTGIRNLWIKDRATGAIEKTPRLPFNEDLDSLPHIDRSMWDPWVVSPDQEVAVLVGRGCPYKCTYCSNHAMAVLSTGNYVRYRSPKDMIEEIDEVSRQYPHLRDIYLEVETIGASLFDALDLFEALAQYNSGRPEKLAFKMNLAIHSGFVKNEAKVRQFFEYCRKANVVGLNVGLESGSERVRKILKRPHYSNTELMNFALMAREHGLQISLYVLIGLPDETPADWAQTVEAVREIQPDAVGLAIFYPYIGTDLYETAKEGGMIPAKGLEPNGERSRAIINLPHFPKWRVRLEYVIFYYRVYKGTWPMSKICARMARAFIAPYPKLETAYRYARSHSKFIGSLKTRYAQTRRAGVILHQ